MKIVVFIIAGIVGFTSYSQELVRNGSFETMLKCPITLGDFFITDWHSTLYGRKTPDYFSNCTASNDFASTSNYIINMKPHSGDSYIGLVGFNPTNGYREYVTTELNSALEKGKIYQFSVSVSQPELSLYYISNLGVLFTKDSLDISKLPNTLITKAHIDIEQEGFLKCRNEWTTFTIKYTASGGEKYLHLGCFLTDEKLLYRTYKDRADFCKTNGYRDAYYLFDDVSLKEFKGKLSAKDSIASLDSQKPLKTFTFSDIKFATGDFSSADKSFDQFNDLIQYLIENPELTVLVEGHTDDVGSEEDNLILSEERALFVLSYFKSKQVSNKIFSKGYGEARPLYVNDTEKNKAANRRVVVKVY